MYMYTAVVRVCKKTTMSYSWKLKRLHRTNMVHYLSWSKQWCWWGLPRWTAQRTAQLLRTSHPNSTPSHRAADYMGINTYVQQKSTISTSIFPDTFTIHKNVYCVWNRRRYFFPQSLQKDFVHTQVKLLRQHSTLHVYMYKYSTHAGNRVWSRATASFRHCSARSISESSKQNTP